MLTLILLKKIISLYIILLMGTLSVKAGLLKSSDSRILSAVCLYIISPCVIISSFQIERSSAIFRGLLFSIAAALLVMLLFFTAAELLRKPLNLITAEKAALEYPNVGNLIIPLVTAILGQEYVVYCTGFIIVHTILTWTHLKIMLSGEKKADFKKIIFNPNIIAIIIGLLLFLFNIHLPYIITETLSSVSPMLGPMSMLITGMIVGGMDFRKTFINLRIWLLSVGRLILFPFISLLLLKYSGISSLVENGKLILMITLLAASAPTASNTIQLSQIYLKDTAVVDYVSALNVITTLSCVITMPLMITLYQL